MKVGTMDDLYILYMVINLYNKEGSEISLVQLALTEPTKGGKNWKLNNPLGIKLCLGDP